MEMKDQSNYEVEVIAAESLNELVYQDNARGDDTVADFANNHGLPLEEDGEWIAVEECKVYAARWLPGSVAKKLDSDCRQITAMTRDELVEEFGEEKAKEYDWMF